MKTFTERFNFAFKKTGFSQHQLAEYVKVSQPAIKKLVSGETKSFRKMAELASALNVDFVWLSTGRGNPIDNEGINFKNSNLNKSDSYVVDVLNVEASAGVGMMNTDIVEVVKSIEYNNEEARKLFAGRDSEDIKIINIKGDSMRGTFESGDLIFVDRKVSNFDGDGIYVFIFGKSLFIKRLQLVKDRLRVLSDNKNYEPWDIEVNEIDQLYIQGKVLYAQSMELKKYG